MAKPLRLFVHAELIYYDLRFLKSHALNYLRLERTNCFLTFQTRMVSKALGCINNHLDDIQDSYTISLVTYTLVLADHPKADNMITRLKKKAIVSKG